jgi:predicted SAM-dependent methyltransferase
MKLLNIGCGSVRPAGWTNLDNLHEVLKEGTPERKNLDKETNYVDHNLPEVMPFIEGTFDGILCGHVIEHFDCQDAVKILNDCFRLLKIGGLLVVSVPNADYFLDVYEKDKPDKAIELFGEPICPDEPWHKSFFDYALFYNQHKQILTRTSVECLLLKSGFKWNYLFNGNFIEEHAVGQEINKIMNRRMFSLEMCAIK